MVHINHQQNNFSAGVIQPEYISRADLNLYGNGVKAMHNMDILPSGALQKRQGTKNIMRIRTRQKNKSFQARLETFTSYDDRNFILVFTSGKLEIFEIKDDDNVVYHGNISDQVIPYIRELNKTKTVWKSNPSSQDVFWNNNNIDQFKIAKGENYFMICHAKHQPILLLYSPNAEREKTETLDAYPPFVMRHWITHINEKGQYKMPYSRFDIDESVQMKLESAIEADGIRYYYLSADTPVFDESWVHAAIRIKDNGGKEIEITSFINDQKLYCKIVGVTGTTNIEGRYTNDWSQAVFSGAKGWPSCAAFHQGRLILAGSESLPKTIWMSKSGDYHDLTLGENNDAAIDVTLASSEAGKIRHLLSSKHLQIFTASSEWVITDEVITPSSISAQKRTSIGIHKTGSVAPLLLNGSSLFFDNENNLHEYTYASLEDSYVVNNISRLTDTNTGQPLKMAYDSQSRRLFCPWNYENGQHDENNQVMKILNLYSAEKITAWNEYKTVQGNFIDIACVKGRIFALTLRYFEHDGIPYFSCYLEQFTKTTKRDCQSQILISSEEYIDAALQIQEKILLDTETKEIGFYNFNDLTNPTSENDEAYANINVSYINNALQQANILVDTPIFASLPIEAFVESLVPVLISRETHSRYRILQATFHIGCKDSMSASLKTASKDFNPDHTNMGDNTARSVTIFGSGWSDNLEDQIWKIHFTNRSDFTLYGAEMHLSVH